MSSTAPGVTPHAPQCAASNRSLVVAVAGSGGDGVALLGDLLMSIAAHQGLYGMLVQSYGPQIRGGESAVVLRLAESEVAYEGDQTDLLVCFRISDLMRFRGSLHVHPNSVLVLDTGDQGELPAWLGTTTREIVRYPFATRAAGVEVAGEPKNMMALALVAKALGWEREHAERALEERFAHRPHLLAADLAAYRAAWAKAAVPAFSRLQGHGLPLEVETGNEAVARGALAAGLRFFAGYPITPSSEVMETLLAELPAAGGTVVQAEDEIAALGMVVGASFGGVPSMTATSGPGLSLMTEMMGLASMAEIPAVIVDCQRAGPATGMPSRTEQSDLFHAVYGGHGDFPRAVLGLFDVVHAHTLMYKAFALAEDYQLPVLVLSDAYVAQRRQIRAATPACSAVPRRWRWTSDDSPARFKLNGGPVVTAFRIPGTPGGTYLAAGIEHSEDGSPTSDTQMHQRMNDRRFRKLPAIALDTADWVRTLGLAEAPRGIIAWGSMYGLLREWVIAHPEYRVFLPEILVPFPLAALAQWRVGLTETVTLELSHQGQFHRYLSSLTDMSGVRCIARSGGLPMSAPELAGLLASTAADAAAEEAR